MNKLISCLISVYGKENPQYLEKCLESIHLGTVVPGEIVLVCDGPLKEEHYQVINRFQSLLPLETVRLEKNMGLSAALNQGLKHCKADWIARMDSDDICMSDRFEKQIRYIASHPEVDVFGGQIEEYDDSMTTPLGLRIVPTLDAELKKFALRRNPMNHMTVMYRRSVIDLAGGYPNLKLMEDYALWLRLMKNGVCFGNLEDVLVKVRAGESMIRRRGGLSYIKSEFLLQREMHRLSFKNIFRAYIDFFLRSTIFLSPAAIRSKVYKYALRKIQTLQG